MSGLERLLNEADWKGLTTQSAVWASATIISKESRSLHLEGYCCVEKPISQVIKML